MSTVATRKAKKLRVAAEKEETETDRISSLPDAILYEILSHLPTQLVVRTSVLSKRWRYLWASIPYLLFVQPLPPGPEISVLCPRSEFERRIEAWRASFVRLVDTVLFCREASSIQKFSLDWSIVDESLSARPALWISYAVAHGVREINLSFLGNAELPPCLYTSESLTSLKIYLDANVMNKTLQFPTSISLPSLKTLSLILANLPEGSQIQRLFSCCPVLEDLTLENCTLCADSQTLIVEAPLLKRLAIVACRGFDHTNFTLAAPSLSSFKYVSTQPPRRFRPGDQMSSLTDVELDMGTPWSRIHRGLIIPRLITRDAAQLNFDCIHKLRHVTKLNLSYRCILLLGAWGAFDEQHPSLFSSVKHLKLSIPFYEDQMKSIERVLKTAPNIETLVVESIQVRAGLLVNLEGERIEWERALMSLDQLKEVDVRNFRGTEREVEFLNFVLQNAKRLDTVFITSRYRVHIDQEFLNHHFHFPSASSPVHICVINPNPYAAIMLDQKNLLRDCFV